MILVPTEVKDYHTMEVYGWLRIPDYIISGTLRFVLKETMHPVKVSKNCSAHKVDLPTIRLELLEWLDPKTHQRGKALTHKELTLDICKRIAGFEEKL